ncbi:Spermatogenesis-associated protein 17, partial [Globisporangium splendens]
MPPSTSNGSSAASSNAEIVISRVYRGHLVRRRYHHLREQDRLRKRELLFHYYAVVVQKSLRGMHSRRHKLDFRIRKAYMREIATKGDDIRRRLAENLRQQQLEEERAVEAEAKRELVEVTQNLHHLVSARAIAGVYCAPMQPADPVTSFGVPVGVHIRKNTKAVVADQLARAKPPTSLLPYLPPNKATVQASSVYGADLKAVHTQKKYHKLRRLSAADFQTVCNAARDDARKRNEPGINAGVEYLDDWKNPYKKRGVPRSKEDLLLQLTTLEKAPKKPFHLTYGGNKSKVLPNDRFDV